MAATCLPYIAIPAVGSARNWPEVHGVLPRCGGVHRKCSEVVACCIMTRICAIVPSAEEGNPSVGEGRLPERLIAWWATILEGRRCGRRARLHCCPNARLHVIERKAKKVTEHDLAEVSYNQPRLTFRDKPEHRPAEHPADYS
jgi:hypothetical protein